MLRQLKGFGIARDPNCPAESLANNGLRKSCEEYFTAKAVLPRHREWKDSKERRKCVVLAVWHQPVFVSNYDPPRSTDIYSCRHGVPINDVTYHLGCEMRA